MHYAIFSGMEVQTGHARASLRAWGRSEKNHEGHDVSALYNSISGLVVEYIVAIDVAGARFPADAAEYSEPALLLRSFG